MLQERLARPNARSPSPTIRVRSDATPRAFAARPRAYATARPMITAITQSGSDARQAAQVGLDVDPRKPADRPDRHEEQQGERDATQQPGGVVAETGVDPEDARRVAIEDQEGEDGEHDPDRTEVR